MRTNEEQLDLFADLLEPVAEILSDKEVSEALKSSGKPILAVKTAIKGHKEAIVRILALIDGVPEDEYIVPPPAGLMVKIMNLINDPQMQDLFTLQGQNTTAASTGSATANIEDGVN